MKGGCRGGGGNKGDSMEVLMPITQSKKGMVGGGVLLFKKLMIVYWERDSVNLHERFLRDLAQLGSAQEGSAQEHNDQLRTTVSSSGTQCSAQKDKV